MQQLVSDDAESTFEELRCRPNYSAEKEEREEL